jgi:peptide/nickel transport system permease protein
MAETPIDIAGTPGVVTPERVAVRDRTPFEAVAAYCRRNPQVIVGLVMIILLLLVGIVGPFFVDTKHADPLSTLPALSPSRTYPLGTDDQGRDLLAVMVAGLPDTLRIGFLAGAIGLGIGIILGFLSGYLGGPVDAFVRILVDTFLTIPGLLILITVAASIRTFISVNIISRELLPNLFPFLAASFVGAVFGAILFSIGLEALGLGPQNQPTVGMTIYWAIRFNALLRGMWWWWVPPILVLVFLFFGLLLLTIGLDEIANPRLRRTA